MKTKRKTLFIFSSGTIVKGRLELMWKVGISSHVWFRLCMFLLLVRLCKLFCFSSETLYSSTSTSQDRRSLGISSWLNDFLFLLSHVVFLHHQLFHCECSFRFMNNKFTLSSVQSRKCLGVVSEWHLLKRRMQNVNLCSENQPGVLSAYAKEGRLFIGLIQPFLLSSFLFFCFLYLQLRLQRGRTHNDIK